LALVLWSALAAPAVGWAALGQPQSAVEGDSLRLHARHAVARSSAYDVHELTLADGSRLRQYVGGNGRIFAVRWNTRSKPDLGSLLGSAFASYSGAARQAAQQPGVQRQFRHEGTDLVVQSAGHLTTYQGFAYRPSLLPKGVSPSALGLGSGA